jgi:UTP-glucose-1-phosphate uridylyltransferase
LEYVFQQVGIKHRAPSTVLLLVNRSAIVYHLIKSVGKVEVKAIVPVAGIGTRLRPHTYTYPKPLLTVAGKPILSYVLEPLLQCEPDEVIFVIGFKSELIRRYVESHYSFKATFVQQDELLGLGYAVRLGMESIDRGPVLVILGDTIVDCDLGDFLRTGDSTLTVCQTSDRGGGKTGKTQNQPGVDRLLLHQGIRNAEG